MSLFQKRLEVWFDEIGHVTQPTLSHPLVYHYSVLLFAFMHIMACLAMF